MKSFHFLSYICTNFWSRNYGELGNAYSLIDTYETEPYFLQIFQSNASVCLIISVFCKSCEPICEPEITPLLYHLENLQKSKQNNLTFSVQCTKSYKTRKWISSCIGYFEENMDLSQVYLAVNPKKISCDLEEIVHRSY